MLLFVPKCFNVPETLETERFNLRKLTVDDVKKDFDAVISSVGHLKGIFGQGSEWPSENLTIEQDLADLFRHQKDFEERKGFTYTVMAPDESQCIGCVYIYPSEAPEFDAVVFLWVRTSEYKKKLDPILFRTVKRWIKKEWPFKRVAYPGREK